MKLCESLQREKFESYELYNAAQKTVERQQKEIVMLEQKLQKLQLAGGNSGAQSGMQTLVVYSQSVLVSSYRRLSSCLMSRFLPYFKHKEKNDDPFDGQDGNGNNGNNNNMDL